MILPLRTSFTDRRQIVSSFVKIKKAVAAANRHPWQCSAHKKPCGGPQSREGCDRQLSGIRLVFFSQSLYTTVHSLTELARMICTTCEVFFRNYEGEINVIDCSCISKSSARAHSRCCEHSDNPSCDPSPLPAVPPGSHNTTSLASTATILTLSTCTSGAVLVDP